MDNKSYDQFLIIQYTIDTSSEKMNKQESKFDKLMAMVKKMMDEIQISNSSPDNMDSPKSQYPTTVVPYNSKAPPLEGGNSTKIGGVWTLKHKISSPKFYELLIKTELKGDTDLDLKNFYNHIKMCLNAVTVLI